MKIIFCSHSRHFSSHHFNLERHIFWQDEKLHQSIINCVSEKCGKSYFFCCFKQIEFYEAAVRKSEKYNTQVILQQKPEKWNNREKPKIIFTTFASMFIQKRHGLENYEQCGKRVSWVVAGDKLKPEKIIKKSFVYFITYSGIEIH